MANIEEKLKAIMEAEYGEEVRSAIHDAIKAGNDEIIEYGQAETEREAAETERVNAETERALAEEIREAIKEETVEAKDAANEAAERANATAEGDISEKTVNFEEAETEEPLESGDTTGTLFGKIKKRLSDLKNGAAGSMLGQLFQPGKVLISDENGKVAESEITSDELETLSGMEENIKEKIEELNGKIVTLSVKQVVVPNAGGLATLSIAEHVSGAKATIPVIISAGSANWNQSVGIQNKNLLVVSGPGVIQGYNTTVYLYIFK